MGATKLGLYQSALREIGEAKIADLSDSNERRRVLDDVYDKTLAWCLEQGYWNHALRAVKVEADTGATPSFGWDYLFTKPSDWVKTARLAQDEDFSGPFQEYWDGVSVWLANIDTLYVQYVSNDDAYGNDLTSWPASYERFVELTLASRICHALTQNQARKEKIDDLARRAKRDALSKDALNEPQGRQPFQSEWTASRGGGRGGDRGNRGSLLG